MKMKSINDLYAEGRSIVEECCGDVIGDITDISINTRSQKRWGLCHHNLKNDTFQIQISKRILLDEVPYDATLSVMIHEILHACEGGQSHKGMWKVYAKKVMDKYPELVITRTNSSDFFGLEPRKRPERIYAVQCDTCGKVIRRARKVYVIKHPEVCIHKYCGGHFTNISQTERV